MGKTGRRWSFLLAFEEVLDERGLGNASPGPTEDTLPLQTLLKLGFSPLLSKKMLGLTQI